MRDPSEPWSPTTTTSPRSIGGAALVARRGGTVVPFPRWKRALDLALGVPLLVLALLVMAIVAAAMRLSGDHGSLLFRAVRLGEGGATFRIVKIRTMRPDAAGPSVTSAGDRRITPLGRALRRAKIDELPQLWNVIRGEMSLVGPRPEDPRFADWSDPLHQAVFIARPGITGLAQIAYRREEELVPADDLERVYRGEILPAKLLLDAAYLAAPSLAGDVRILARTLLAVIAR